MFLVAHARLAVCLGRALDMLDLKKRTMIACGLIALPWGCSKTESTKTDRLSRAECATLTAHVADVTASALDMGAMTSAAKRAAREAIEDDPLFREQAARCESTLERRHFDCVMAARTEEALDGCFDR